jgi:predicted nucleic acid-binding protein
MPEAVVISNTSPVFYLHQIGRLEVLRDIYGTVIIPPGVERELEAGAAKGLDIPSISRTTWLEVQPLKSGSRLPVVPDLGSGEAEVIALGLEHQNSLVIIDDELGRRIARLNQLRLTGTLGVLLRAKAKGLVAELGPLMDSLKARGMRLSDALVQRVLAEAGERPGTK